MKPWLIGLLCFVLGLIVVPLGVFAYLDFGRPPVAVADTSFPFERQVVRAPLRKRMESELEKPPIAPDPQNLLAGAEVYAKQCAACHGLPNHPSEVGRNMFPTAPQLWAKHRNGVVGVSDDPPGETYWRVKNGIRLTGMPSYQKLLSEQQMWQTSLLLAAAAGPLPADVQAALEEKQ